MNQTANRHTIQGGGTGDVVAGAAPPGRRSSYRPGGYRRGRVMTRTLWVFFDAEMSGLDPHRHVLLEVAMLVADPVTLEVLGEFGSVIGHSELDLMRGGVSEWCRAVHGESGLLHEVMVAQTTLPEIDRACAQFLTDVASRLATCDAKSGTSNVPRRQEQQQQQQPQQAPPQRFCFVLAGASVHQDRAFLRTQMPLFQSLLHHRHVDVSTVLTCVRTWSQQSAVHAALPPMIAPLHRARTDVWSTLNLLRHFRASVFLPLNAAARPVKNRYRQHAPPRDKPQHKQHPTSSCSNVWAQGNKSGAEVVRESIVREAPPASEPPEKHAMAEPEPNRPRFLLMRDQTLRAL